MSIIGKYLLKNMFAKPFRTILLVVCICACSFVALLSFDIIGSMEPMVKTMLTQITGSSDIMMHDSVGVTKEFDIPYENEQLLVYEKADGTTMIPEGFYAFFQKKDFSVVSMDYEKAYKMRLMKNVLTLGKREAAITKTMAARENWKVGDVISLTDLYEEQQEFTVVEILENYGNANGKCNVYVSMDDYAKLVDQCRAKSIYVDVLNDSEAKAASEELKEIAYNATVQLLVDSEENKEMIMELSILFFLIFLVCFFLVIFVAISVSSRIVCERIAVVGTFRSLGLSSSFTTRILLVETGLYGFIGGLLGVVLYLVARTPIFYGIFEVEAAGNLELDTILTPLSPLAVVGCIMIGVLVMCICPLKEILKTSKMAIRDIIFDNKDTAYQFRKSTVGIGIICAIVSVVTNFFVENGIAQIVCFAMLMVAVALLFPLLLRLFANCLAKLFAHWNMPIAHMAAVESCSKKSTVGSTVLCVTASTLALIIFIFVSTLDGVYDLKTFDCDVISYVNDDEDVAQFAYIKDLEGVTETETIYNLSTSVLIKEQKQDANIFALNDGGYRLLTAIENCPTQLDPDSMLMDKGLAKKWQIQVGDEVEITFDATSFLPMKKKMKLAGFINSYQYDTVGNAIVISMDRYIDMYHEQAGEILVRCDNPQKVVEQLHKYSGTTLSDIQTIETYKNYWQDKKKGMMGMLLAVIVFGIGLTVVGMVSNQLIGFEGRKRECAVLASTSMTRQKVAWMLILESMIASGIALLVAFPLAFIAFEPFKRMLVIAAVEFPIVYHVEYYGIFIIALWVTFTMVALFPVRKLRKMNLADQLKYE